MGFLLHTSCPSRSQGDEKDQPWLGIFCPPVYCCMMESSRCYVGYSSVWWTHLWISVDLIEALGLVGGMICWIGSRNSRTRKRLGRHTEVWLKASLVNIFFSKSNESQWTILRGSDKTKVVFINLFSLCSMENQWVFVEWSCYPIIASSSHMFSVLFHNWVFLCPSEL